MIVIAGHNGAGKTTIYNNKIAPLLGELVDLHINADEIEKEIACSPEGQGRNKKELEQMAADEATRRRRFYLQLEVNFSFETVFSDPEGDKAAFMEKARHLGYNIILMAVGLESIEKSKERVAQRHAKGGHNVEPEKLEARYPRVLTNFALGAKVASLAIFMDNSSDNHEDGNGYYQNVACFENGNLIASDDSPPAWWQVVLSQLLPISR